MGEIPGALAEAVIVVDQRPVCAAVIAAVEAAFFRFDQSVDDIRIRAGNADTDSSERAFGHAVAFDAFPGGAIVVGTIEAVFFTAAIERPGSAVAFPHGSEEDVRILGIENDVNAASAVVEIKNFFPSLTAIACAEDAALGIGAVSVAEGCDEGDIGIRGMNDDLAYVTRVFQTDVSPGFAGVVRTIDAIAEGDVAANAGFAAASINHVGIGIGDGDAADRGGGGLLIEERIPGIAAVGGFPDAAGDRAEIVGVRLAGHTRNGQGAAAAERADEAPLHSAIGFGIDGVGRLLRD